MSRTRVKICGLRSASDALAAAAAGADALGVILAPGYRRSLTPHEAAEVFAGCPDGVERVGVFVDAALEDIVAAIGEAGLTEVQLHGRETPEFCAQLRSVAQVRVVKTLHVGESLDVRAVDAYIGVVDAVLLDTMVPGAPGGTGRSFDWDLATGATGPLPVYLAGGLTPLNVESAVTRARPAGVDVSSGVEGDDGRKCVAEMKRFVAAVRAADTEDEERR